MTHLGIRLSRYAARFGAGGLLLVSLVIGGLLSVPTRCTCGAESPHEHSIFTLRSHWHSPYDHDPSAEIIRVRYDGPTLSVGESSAFASGVADLESSSLSIAPAGILPNALRDTTPVHGRSHTPESPPPRV
jgi:hypothetical protein